MPQVKPTHKPIKDYYSRLDEYHAHGVEHEGAVSTAFLNLLDATRPRAWGFTPQETLRIGGRTIIPDGTLRDDWNQQRGHWEAKDEHDDLDAEIEDKRAKGYPLTNIIFEDTREAVLYQDRQEAMRVDLGEPQSLADLLNVFYEHTEPHHEEFGKAVADFKDRVPDLAKGLVAKIAQAHTDNAEFQAAFEKLFSLCERSLNPNIAREAVDEMLVQHLLTERLIRRVFDRDNFVRQNVIAAEVEKVIDALTSHAFSKHEFLKSLDRFYVAIENEAHTIEDFSEKQHFLDMVYERFFQGYSVKIADTHGIVYTPQPIVDFMCASVVEVLKDEFGKTLGDPDVCVLDPCTGTGNFIVNLLRRVPKEKLKEAYAKRFFANEVMLLPYYIAALNIEHAYYELTGEYEPFEGLCFVDTLDLAESRQMQLGFMTEKNTERVERQKNAPITVIIGNPPYNARQVNENDNNKNRKYEHVDRAVSETYARDSAATNKTALSDPYVKFFRWATDRLGSRDGIVCFVTNNSVVDQSAFDGMRKHLAVHFSDIYHVDLHGNVRKNPKLSGTTHNVFGIQVGVGITVAVKRAGYAGCRISYVRAEENWRREEKCAWLDRQKAIGGVDWEALTPDDRSTWLVPKHADEFETYVTLGSKEAKAAERSDSKTVFMAYSLGVTTARDTVAYGFARRPLGAQIIAFVEDYNSEVDRWRRSDQKVGVDDFVRYDKIPWSRDLKQNLVRGSYVTYAETKVRLAMYRPYTPKFLYYDRILNEQTRLFSRIYPTPDSECENRVICLSGIGHDVFRCQVANRIVDIKFANSANGSTQCFPFYVYDEDGTNVEQARTENVTDWCLNEFRAHYGDQDIGKWDIFWYVYGVLHHPAYREKFADNLKRELPRTPYAPDFRAFSEAGKQLADLHLGYEEVEPWPLEFEWADDATMSWHVEKMRLSKDKASVKVNETLTLHGIPEAAYEYRLGNRSAVEWIVDQYRIKTDKSSGITHDPNTYSDDERYIVDLFCRVVRVSMETVAILDRIAGLPYT